MEWTRELVLSAEPNWTTVVTVSACGLGAVLILSKWLGQQQARKKVLKARRRRADSLLQAEQAVQRYKDTHPTWDKTTILSLSLPELTKRLKAGTLNPEDVFYTYVEKTLEVNKSLNCCTEILLDSFDQLKKIDSSNKGLLYGVPVSIKDNYGYKGHDSTCGVICKLDQPVLEDCVLVQVLKRQGAIPFVKTNVPQGLLSYDCSNPIYGQSLNPHNLNKVPGGSSGGEGALIGAGGSVLGFGTDLGGSVRIPASFCGICTIKPTSKRLSLRGIESIVRGQKAVSSAAGPLARGVDDLALCMEALLSDHMFSLDPTVPPIPFNLQVYQSTKPLRIGYYENDGYQQPSPSMARGFREAKALLEQAGHTLVPYSPLRLSHAMHEFVVKGVLGDGAVTLIKTLKGGPVDPCLRPQIISYRLPYMVKKLLSKVLQPLFPRVAATLNSLCGVGSVDKLWKQHASIEDYIHETIAEWRRLQIDVLLCPMLGPAYDFFYCGKLTSAISYTILYNLLNFPAGVVPVSTVTAADEEELKHYKGNFQDPWDKFFKQAVAGSEGLPVAVQCVALPWQEELCLRLMKEVERLVRENRKSEGEMGE